MELRKPVDWGPIAELQDYIEENFPDLSALLPGTMPFVDCLDVLNKYTGLDIDPNTSVSEGCETFLARLKEMKECR